MILYFTGTGNSYFVAKRIAEGLNDNIKSMNKLIKEGFNGELYSDKPLIFVSPTYAWRMPRIVEDFIRKVNFQGNNKSYFVLTCDSQLGNAGKYAKKLCFEKGLEYRGMDCVFMPENYIVFYPSPDEIQIYEKLEAAKKKIESIILEIQSGRQLKSKESDIIDIIESSSVNYLFYKFAVKAKGFRVTDKCIACGKCEKLCPMNNITLEKGKPVWGKSCTHCMACINRCPKEAIEYKNNTIGKKRYYLNSSENIRI